MASEHHDEQGVYDLSAPGLLGRQGLRMIQLQPTRRCNLSCRHCYSESGPGKGRDLPFERVGPFLSSAFDLGYSYVGVSGGEPLLWSDLEKTLSFARRLGYSTSVSTNATLLTPQKASLLKDIAGIVAVSVDGPPEEHALMRNSETAFDAMLRGLDTLRTANVPFTLSFTFTQFNADRLSWLYRFAVEEGAAGIHVHPLFSFGAASGVMDDAVPDSYEFKVASWLLALLIQDHGPGGPVVTFDVMQRERIRQSPWYSSVSGVGSPGRPRFSDLVPSLILETDGCIVPFIYGFPRKWALGFSGAGDFDQLCSRWSARHGEALRSMVKRTLEQLEASGAEYCDFFGELHRTAALTADNPNASENVTAC